MISSFSLLIHMDRTVQPTKPASTKPTLHSRRLLPVQARHLDKPRTLLIKQHTLSCLSSPIEVIKICHNHQLGLTGQAKYLIPAVVKLVLQMKTLIPIQVTLLVSWRGEGAVSGFANHNPNKTLAILPTKPSGLHYDQRCIQAYDQPYNQSSDRPVIRKCEQ